MAGAGIAVLLVLALAISSAPAVLAQRSRATWLEPPVQPFNVPGASVPPAPAGAIPIIPQCTTRERAPRTPAEQRLAEAGWRLQASWPEERAGDIAVILATANYDGMCRPLGFNAFVFAGEQFAGTLSPVVMSSRSDGVLSTVPTLFPGGIVEARFLRYAPSDPLCCPSLPPTIVTYRVAGGAQPVVEPDHIGPASVAPDTGEAEPSAGTPRPTSPPDTPSVAQPVVPRLPRTGQAVAERAASVEPAGCSIRAAACIGEDVWYWSDDSDDAASCGEIVTWSSART